MQILPPNVCKSYKGNYNQYNDTLKQCVVEYYDLSGQGVLEPHVLCAKNPQKGKATCQGDSGGPLMVKENGRHILVGITSGGFGCGLVSFLLDPRAQGTYSKRRDNIKDMLCITHTLYFI